MSLDSFTDTQIATLLMLATGAANADHQTTAGEPVVVGAVGAPFDIGMLGMAKLPALFIYRPNGTTRAQSQFDVNADSVFVVDYWLPATPLMRIPERWPLLRKVWLTIAAAFQGGMHASVSNGAQVLRQAGLRTDVGGHRVDYSRGLSDGGVYPFFRATFRIYEEGSDVVGVTDVADLPAFVELYSEWMRPDATATTPSQDHTIYLHGYPPQNLTPLTLVTQGGQPLITQGGDQLLVQGV